MKANVFYTLVCVTVMVVAKTLSLGVVAEVNLRGEQMLDKLLRKPNDWTTKF